MAFVRCRVPETGSHISVHTDALRAHPTLQPLGRPPTDRPEPDKANITRRRRAAASTPEE